MDHRVFGVQKTRPKDYLTWSVLDTFNQGAPEMLCAVVTDEATRRPEKRSVNGWVAAITWEVIETTTVGASVAELRVVENNPPAREDGFR